jgi:hypothetical protein
VTPRPATNDQFVKLTPLDLTGTVAPREVSARCRLKSYLAGFVLAEIGCAVRVNVRRY